MTFPQHCCLGRENLYDFASQTVHGVTGYRRMPNKWATTQVGNVLSQAQMVPGIDQQGLTGNVSGRCRAKEGYAGGNILRA